MTPFLMISETISNQLLKLPNRPRNAPRRNRKSKTQAAKRIPRQDGKIAPHQMRNQDLVVNLITHQRAKRIHLITRQMMRSQKIQDKTKVSLKFHNKMRKLHLSNQMMENFLKNLSLASQLLLAPLSAMMISLAQDTFLQESAQSEVCAGPQAPLAWTAPAVMAADMLSRDILATLGILGHSIAS